MQCMAWGAGEQRGQRADFGGCRFGAGGNRNPEEDSEQTVDLSRCFGKRAGSGEQKAGYFSVTHLWAPSKYSRPIT